MTWLQRRLLEYLKSQLRNVEGIIDEVETADNANQEYFLNRVIETVGQVEETASELLRISSQVLEKFEKEKMTLDDSNQKAFPTMPSLDPGLRSKHLTDSQKTYLIQIGPNQPNLQVYPSNSSIAKEGHKPSSFNPSWFKEYPHLEYSLSKDAAFCFVCSLFGSGPGMEKAENVWSTEELWKSKAWQVGNTFLICESQKCNVFAYANFVKTCGHMDVLLSKTKRHALIQEEEDLVRNRKVVKILLDITKTLRRQGVAFRGHGDDKEGNFHQIVMSMARYCPDLKFWFSTTRMRPYCVTYLSQQSQNEFIELIGRQVQKRVTKEIKEAGMYSVMADTTPDVRTKIASQLLVGT
ncbi:Hypothetical predicted protein [Paramuricea clavata]|uniref:Uncharacterized protein n=1 Tax=Paramuricea clavata TaxID=317549 RepID=A0A6S7H715_PARCT|nr:Hypothetical predicted protein [Paramuricea clavata]